MHRCLYRAECAEGVEAETFFRSVRDRAETVAEQRAVTVLGLFGCDRSLFLYYECEGDKARPEELFPGAEQVLLPWPGTGAPRLWAPMMDIFHYQRPVSREHWKRIHNGAVGYGRIALLKPDQVASYVYYHYQYQEERPGDGDKYGIIGLHENLLFFYSETPATREPAPYKGLLNTSLRPDDWAGVMDPHFSKWEGVPEGEEIWLRLSPILELRSPQSKQEESKR
ncbi:hypothetical protein ACE6ED_01985 [Paenibacillus sp. CN-4]|uniref:hypothetical protein n=1 Tax=Paenibacillus nanchangensis TaxID=3348343 RepID=UPI003979BB3B